MSPTGVRRLRALERVHLLTNSSVSSDVREAVRALNARVPYLGQMEHFLCIAIALKFGRITADDYMNYQFRENQLDKRRVLDLAPKPDGGVLRFGHLRLSIQDYFNIDLKPVIRELRTVIEFVYAHLVEIEVLLPPEDEPAPHDNDTGRQERPPDRTDGRPRMTMARPDPRPAGRPSRHTSMDPSAASVIDPRISRRFQDAPSEDRSKRTSNWTSRSIRPSDSLRPEGDIGMMPRPPESQPPRQPETAAPALPGRLRATSGGNTSVVVQRSVANTTSNWTSITNDRASYTGIRRSGARVEKSYKGLGVKSTYFNGSTGHWTSSFELDVDENSDADGKDCASMTIANKLSVFGFQKNLRRLLREKTDAQSCQCDGCHLIQPPMAVRRPLKRPQRRLNSRWTKAAKLTLERYLAMAEPPSVALRSELGAHHGSLLFLRGGPRCHGILLAIVALAVVRSRIINNYIAEHVYVNRQPSCRRNLPNPGV